ncbi:hypothetical protein K4L44_14390 [Halosquirtibacter laminarini]|uniref:Uncharacterized protein n=1 Tax=Halosquirtibacter laminarini TaxID=3374600 RepID=A0AC61NDY3_9BACT|nr:hypothetical protein K4L44_14390 [Prolixibacteraceae bacterium]
MMPILVSCKYAPINSRSTGPEYSRLKSVTVSIDQNNQTKQTKAFNDYNNDGLLIRSNTYDKSNELIHYKLYYYNLDGNIQDIITYFKKNSHQKHFVVKEMIIYEYDKRNHVTEKIVNSLVLTKNRTVRFFYDQDGLLIKQQVIKDKKITKESAYTYDHEGKRTKKKIDFILTDHTNQIKYDYTDGVLTSETTYNEEGKVISCRNFYYNTINERILEEHYIYSPKHTSTIRRHFNYEVTNKLLSNMNTEGEIDEL